MQTNCLIDKYIRENYHYPSIDDPVDVVYVRQVDDALAQLWREKKECRLCKLVRRGDFWLEDEHSGVLVRIEEDRVCRIWGREDPKKS